MKYLHSIIWVLLLAVLCYYSIHYSYLASEHVSLHIVQLELANTANGKALLNQWFATPVGNKTLLHYAQVNTIADFFFIIAYVGVLIIWSYAAMQKESNPVLNDLLRLNLLLAIIVGLLDIVEDCIMLFDMYNYSSKRVYISSMIPAYTKWLLAAYILVIILWSLGKRVMQKRFRSRVQVA